LHQRKLKRRNRKGWLPGQTTTLKCCMQSWLFGSSFFCWLMKLFKSLLKVFCWKKNEKTKKKGILIVQAVMKKKIKGRKEIETGIRGKQS
jgi:hypothetical protein